MRISSIFHSIVVILFTCFAFLNIACDSQKSFTPTQVKGKILFNESLPKPLVLVNREGAKLKDNTSISTLPSTQRIILDENEILLSLTNINAMQRLIVAKGCQSLEIIPFAYQNNSISLDREHTQTIQTESCVVAASLKNNLIAGIFGDNTLFLYDLNTKTFIFKEKGESVYAISSLIANPVFLDTLVIFPTLDGRLETIDTQQLKSIKNIIVNTEKFLNNIIYLKVQKDELVAATQKRLYTLVKGESYNKDLEIRDLLFDGEYIYVLALNGVIYKFDKTLAMMKSIKLPYANLNGIIIKDNHLYTFENSGGYLVNLNLADFTYEVFALKFGMQRWFSKKSTIFYTNDTLYINNNALNLSRPYTTEIKGVKQ